MAQEVSLIEALRHFATKNCFDDISEIWQNADYLCSQPLRKYAFGERYEEYKRIAHYFPDEDLLSMRDWADKYANIFDKVEIIKEKKNDVAALKISYTNDSVKYDETYNLFDTSYRSLFHNKEIISTIDLANRSSFYKCKEGYENELADNYIHGYLNGEYKEIKLKKYENYNIDYFNSEVQIDGFGKLINVTTNISQRDALTKPYLYAKLIYELFGQRALHSETVMRAAVVDEIKKRPNFDLTEYPGLIAGSGDLIFGKTAWSEVKKHYEALVERSR